MPNNERLQKWADAVRSIPEENLDMEEWMIDPEKVESVNSVNEIHSCGTAACAAGWLPVIFPEDWVVKGMSPKLRRPNSAVYDTDHHIEEYFDIEPEEIEEIVIPSSYDNPTPHPTEVADRIESFIER